MSEQTKSLWAGLNVPIVGCTGDKWSGKSVFVSSIDPENTLMIDLEMSTETYNFNFKRRISLYHELANNIKDRQPTSLDCWMWFSDLIESIKPGEYTVIAIDPVNDLEAGLVAWVYTHPEIFGHTKVQYDRSSGLMQGDISSYWKLKLGVLAAKIQTLAFTTHLGLVWGADGRPLTGQTKQKGRPVLTELASLYLQLERKPNNKGEIPSKPIARVLKSRLMVSEFVDGEMKMWPVLPGSVPACDPKKIREYIKNPVGKREITEDEKAIAAVNLSDDEKLLVKAQIVGQQLEIEQEKNSRLEAARQAAMNVNRQATAVAASAPQSTSSSASSDPSKLEAAKKAAAAASAAKPRKTKETPAAIPAATEVVEKKPEESATSTEATIAAVTQPIEVSESKPIEATVEAENPASAVQSESTEIAETTTTATAAVDSNPGVTSPVWGIIRKQFAAFNKANPKFTEAAFSATLMDRYKVAVVDGLTQTQAEELRAALGTKLSNLGLDSDGEPTPTKK